MTAPTPREVELAAVREAVASGDATRIHGAAAQLARLMGEDLGYAEHMRAHECIGAFERAGARAVLVAAVRAHYPERG